MLRDKRIDPTAKSNYALVCTCQNGHLEVLELLLKDGRADPGTLDGFPLAVACYKGHEDIVRCLLGHPKVCGRDGGQGSGRKKRGRG
jgi:hypothetical protein